MAASNSDLRVPDSELDFDDELFYRWRGAPFTGIGYGDIPGGGLSEISYRYGARERRERDASGELVATFVVSPDSETHATIERYRREKGWPASE